MSFFKKHITCEVIHHASRNIYINNDTIITSWDITGGNILHKVVFWGYIAHNTRQKRPWEVGILQQPVPANCHGFLFVFSGTSSISRHFPRLCQTTIIKLLALGFTFASCFGQVLYEWGADCEKLTAIHFLYLKSQISERGIVLSCLYIEWVWLYDFLSDKLLNINLTEIVFSWP